MTMLPRSLTIYLGAWLAAEFVLARVSAKMRRKESRVPIAGSGSREGAVKARWCESSVRVQDGQMWMVRCGGSS